MMPHLPATLTTVRLKWLLTLLTLTKILSTTTLAMLGDYRAERISPFRRFVGVTSKVTSWLMAVIAGLLEFSRGDARDGWLFIVASFFVAVFAVFVVNLRARGKFYGVAGVMQRYLSPAQVKLALITFLGVLFILAIRHS